jgi:hypothetical protein
MTSLQMHEGNWGEKKLADRKRRRALIRGAMIAAAVAFGVFAPKLVPAGAAGDPFKLGLSLVYMVVIAAGAALLWRLTDEVERRIAVNSFAAMGFASMFLTIGVMVAVPVLHIVYPAMTIFMLCLAVGGLTYLVQRLRA